MDTKQIKEEGGVKMKGGGTWGEPIGSWSDDTSMALCTLEALQEGYNLKEMGNKFIKWKNENLWTSHGHRFDIGNQTLKALNYLENGKHITKEESKDGNGSLMRILPTLFFIGDNTIEEQFKIISKISSLTHPTDICIYGCFVYVKYAELILNGYDKKEAYKKLKETMRTFLPIEIQNIYKKILSQNILNIEELKTNGYIVSSLELIFYTFMKYESFEEIIIKTIELGGDTDTNGAIVGGLAGLYYGYNTIPEKWIKHIPKKRKINLLLK